MNWNVRSGLIALAFFISAGAHAGQATVFSVGGDEETNAGDRIQACSNLLGGNALALAQGEASRNRGSAFTDLEQYDLAIADETKAIELDALDAAA